MNSSDAIAAQMNQPASGWRAYSSFMLVPPASTRLFAASEPFFPIGAFGERNGVEHRGALVAEDHESAADRASGLVVAIATGRIEVHAGAGHESDGAFHRADDLAEGDFLGRTGEL